GRDSPGRAGGRPATPGTPGAAGGPRTGRRPGADPLLACLARATLALGQPVGEADIRAATPLPARPMTVDDFRRAARRLGYRTRPESVSRDQLATLPRPFLLPGEAGRPHRLVIGREEGGLMTFDPDAGETAVIAAERLAGDTAGVVLIAPRNGAAAGSDWRRLVLRRIKGVASDLLLASLVVNLFALATPLFMMTVFNKVIGQGAMDTLTVLAVGMLVLYTFDFLLRGARGYISAHTGARIDALIGGEVVHRLLRLPYRQYETTPSGLMAERLRQVDTIRLFFTGQMPLVLVDLLFVVVFLGVLFFLAPTLAFITLGVMPVFLVLSIVFQRTQSGLVEESFAAHAAKGSALNETIANALTIKSLGLESEIEKRWGGRLAQAAWTGFRTSSVANTVATLSAVLQQLTNLLIIVVGVRLIDAGALSIGALIAANILVARTIQPIRQVVSAFSQLQEVRAAFGRLEEIMQGAEEQESMTPMPPIEGRVALDNVTFRYGEHRAPALDKVSLSIPAGTVIGIAGPPGSGKSTLVKIIQGLYQPDDGRVLVDGTDITHMSQAALRAQMGIVPQDVQLFQGTVRDNIAMGLVEKDPARVVAVTRFVGAHDFVERLPQGYETELGERGGGLSAGQRQLLAIARALVRNPRIIILDEATSALDSATEQRLLRALRQAASSRTMIVISHREAPLRQCDRVVVLVDGRIALDGPPEEVLPRRARAAGGPAGGKTSANGARDSAGDARAAAGRTAPQPTPSPRAPGHVAPAASSSAAKPPGPDTPSPTTRRRTA
ncbi:MAG: peptidase domain-containing ABC transporter, partial [Alphaproteobacteria bacterium]